MTLVPAGRGRWASVASGLRPRPRPAHDQLAMFRLSVCRWRQGTVWDAGWVVGAHGRVRGLGLPRLVG
jgi:hypothetical protein